MVRPDRFFPRTKFFVTPNDETTQRLLLAESELTFAKALEIAASQETASKNVQTLRGIHIGPNRVGASNLAPPVEPVHLLKSGKQPLTPPEQKSKDSSICHRCGKGGHLSASL